MLLTLDDMPVGSLVKLFYKLPNGEVSLDTVVRDKSVYGKNTLLCDYLMHNGKIIRCSDWLSKAEIYNTDTKRTYCFMEIKAVNTKKDGLVLASNNKVKPIENREAFRFSCGYNCDIRLKSHTGVSKGIVHDVSFSGISCLISKESSKPIITEEASITVTDGDTRCIYKVIGNVVRIDENYSDDRLLIGVKIKNENSVKELIQNIQRKVLKTRDKR